MTAPDDELLGEIKLAVAAANAAEHGAMSARAEFVSRSERVGMLLREAKKLHPAVKDFKAFLKKVDGLKLSRAYDLLRLAGGRITDEELKRDARERQQKSRAKKLPTPDSVTSRNPSGPASLTQPEPTSPPETESADDGADAESSGWENSEVGRLIMKMSYERAHDLSLWLTYHLIAIRPEAA
jgi:hypothetical protein